MSVCVCEATCQINTAAFWGGGRRATETVKINLSFQKGGSEQGIIYA